MFLFFFTICFAADPKILLAQELGMTKEQAITVVYFEKYDSRKLPLFINDFKNELGSNNITSPQVHDFMGKVFLLLVAYHHQNLGKISEEGIDPSHPLAGFYNELRAKVIETIKQRKES